MEEPRPGSGSATDESFEHVDLHSPEKDRQQAAEAPPAAAPSEQQQAAPAQPAAPPAARKTTVGAADEAPAAAAAPAAGAVAEAPSSPPATKALQSVLGFFSSIAGSPPPAAKEQREAPVAGGSASQQPAAEATGSERAADAAPPAAGSAAADEEPYDPVAAFESEALEAAERLQHGVEEVRLGPRTQQCARACARQREGLVIACQPTATDCLADASPARVLLLAPRAQPQVGQKLLHGAAEAKESLTSFAQGLSSWCVAAGDEFMQGCLVLLR